MRVSKTIAGALTAGFITAAVATPAYSQGLWNELGRLIGGRGGGANAQVTQISLNNFATRQSQLRSEISSNVSSGRLSPGAAQALLASLDQILAMQSNYLADGNLSNAESMQIVSAFGSVTNQLNASVADPYNRNYFGGYPYNNYMGGYGNPFWY